MFDPTDTTPAGVTLSDPMDFKKRRTELFETTKNALERKFPVSYGGFRMEVTDIRYEDPEHYTLKQQKEALLKNRFLSRRLRGTLHLYNEDDNQLMESKELTLMRVPYLTDRGTTIHNGNEYVTLTQARLLPGIYVRKRVTGEIEAHFNARRGTGNAYRIRLEPSTQLYKMDIGQASLRLYSLLHDIGISDERLAQSWGKDILEANKAGYDARVFDKAYQKLVKMPDPEASNENKKEAIIEALNNTKFANSVLQRTLPNLFNRKIASLWFAKQAMMQPQQYQGQNPMINPQLMGKQVADSPDAYVKYEEQKQQAAIKEQERQEKHRLGMELLRGKLPEDGPDRDALEKQMLQSQIALRKAKNQAMTKTIVGQQKFENQEQVRKIKEETQRQLDYVKMKRKELDDFKRDTDQESKDHRDLDIKDMEERRKDKLKEESDHRKERAKEKTENRKADLKEKEEQRKADIKEKAERQKADAKEKADRLKADLKEKADKRKAEIKIQAEKRKAEIARKAEQLKQQLEVKIKKYQTPKNTKKAGEEKLTPRTAIDIMLEAKEHSDLRDYDQKNSKMRALIKENREDFFIDSDEQGMVGITHAPSGFQMHLPKEIIFDLDIPVRNPKEAFYKESKKRNIKVMPRGQMIDIDKLYASVKDRNATLVPFDEVKGIGNRSKRNRFGPKRYENADVTKPGLLDSSNYILDGRHRLAKAKDSKASSGLFYVVTPEDISKAYVDGSHADFKSETKIKL